MKMPPIEKVYEAWTALADGRVRPETDSESDTGVTAAHRFSVDSSDDSRHYTVAYDPDTDAYASDDNATYWRGYPGYPVIAVMMLQGRLPYDKKMAVLWRGVNWNKLNNEVKRDYAAAVKRVEEERGIDSATAAEAAQEVMQALEQLDIKIKRFRG